MAGGDLGEGTRLAAATGAYVCFEDEAGQNLRPPKARTWAPRGHTPVVRVSGKGSGRVSVAGLVCLKPGARDRLFYRVRVHRGRKGERRSMSEADYAGLITAAHQELKAPVILVWDRLNTHVSAGDPAEQQQFTAEIGQRLGRPGYQPAGTSDPIAHWMKYTAGSRPAGRTPRSRRPADTDPARPGQLPPAGRACSGTNAAPCGSSSTAAAAASSCTTATSGPS